MKILVNGKVCDENHAVISVYDHGFLYGMGLFETFRTYRGQCFLLEEHLYRLRQSCEWLGIKWTMDTKQIEKQIYELLQVNGLQDAYFRLTVSSGEAALGLPTDVYQDANTIIYIKELPIIDEELYKIGKPLQRLQIKRNTPEGAFRLKSFHYMNNILAKRELQNYSWAQQAEGLFLNEQNYLAEGIVSNLFFIRHHKLYTPDINTGILAGITRSYVMKLSIQRGMDVEEGHYTWEDLLGADEVFITNSIQEIIPICKLFNEHGQVWTVEEGQAGENTKQLLYDYRKRIGG
jgi:4-amino-4-deoxychorismate lyase